MRSSIDAGSDRESRATPSRRWLPIAAGAIAVLLAAAVWLALMVARRTEIHRAARAGDSAKVADLLRRGADLNARDVMGETPLHYAGGNAHLGVAKLLIQRGADVNARGSGDETPLHWAADQGVEMVRLLLEHGADPNVRNKYGGTPLHFAQSCGQRETADLLQEHGAKK